MAVIPAVMPSCPNSTPLLSHFIIPILFQELSDRFNILLFIFNIHENQELKKEGGQGCQGYDLRLKE
jgi:hypothetical protein